MSVGKGGLTVNPGDWWQVVRDLVISGDIQAIKFIHMEATRA